MLPREFKILLIVLSVINITYGEQLETFCNVNGKKALHYVSEKFLSISIDPAVLLAGLNLSESSLRLAQHLSPAYIRIAGPSTKFVKYVDNEDKFDDRLPDDGNNVVVTPSMWFGINEWLSLANLTPVFGINDVETTRGVWNPKSTLPLLEISDKLNVSCYWELGFDSSQKNELQYKQDLNILSHILAAFPERNESWKMIGSDISNIQQDHMDNVLTELQDTATAVMWEPQGISEDSFPEKDLGWKMLQQQHKPPVKVWTTVPKAEGPVSFSSALLWATQIGNAAKAGYDVVFRQPRLHEMIFDTPAYWFSILHKKLMGSNVLEAKTTVNHQGSSVYSHCTRKQNSFVRRGAITVMVVNSNLEHYKVKVKLGTPSGDKTMEVLSYILTSTGENSTDIFLNGKKLTADLLSERNIFEPTLRRAKLSTYVSLEVPPTSIGFFVLTGARVPVCINEEKEMELLLEEIAEDQNIPLSEELVLTLGSRSSVVNNPTLEEIALRMKKEMESDEKFYNSDHTLNLKLNRLDQRMQEIPMENKVSQRGRKFFIEKAKLAQRQKKHMDVERRREELKNYLSERAKVSDSHKHETKIASRNLDLTSKEVEKILKDRARARAARRNIIFTDEELEALVQKASKQFTKPKFRRSVSIADLHKRDINRRLLDRNLYFDPTSSKAFVENKPCPDCEEFSTNKRKIRKPRDLNMKRLDYQAKLEDNRQRIEDKRHEILGNAQDLKNTIKDKMRKLKYVKRLKRDINMDLVNIKADGQKIKPQREAQRKPPKSLFKDKEDKEATIRVPGQTSAELLEEFEDEYKSVDAVKPTKTEVYAELADPQKDEYEDFFKTNSKPKHGDASPGKENKGSKDGKGSKQGKMNNLDDIQFLTASEEFTDIEEDLPCIHEFFGSRPVNNDNSKDTNVIQELGEIETSERKLKRKKSEKRKMTELGDIGESEQVKDSMELFRNRRDVEKTIKDTLDDDLDVKCQLNHPGIQLELATNRLSGEDDRLVEKVAETENKIIKHEKKNLAGDLLSDDKSVKGLFDLQEENETSDDLRVQPLRRSSENRKIAKRNSDKLTELALYNGMDAMGNSEVDLHKNSEKIHGGPKDFFVDNCLPCSQKNGMTELRNMPRRRDYIHALEDSELAGPKIPLKQSKKTKSSKRYTIKSDGSDSKRGKRDIDQESEGEEKSPDANDAVNHEPVKVQQRMAQDKMKFNQEKMKNKLNLLHMKKRHEQECMANEKGDNLQMMLNSGNEKRNAIMEQLEFLKRKVEQRKKEIDMLLFKDMKLHEKLEEQKRDMLNDILHEGTQAINKAMGNTEAPNRGPNFQPRIGQEANERESPTEDERVDENTPVVKRSIVNPKTEAFGNYRPLTRNLKTWKPSDILSLKRDVSFLRSPKLKPTSDYRTKKDGYFNTIRKRSIDTTINDSENEIDGFMNEIEKDDRYSRHRTSGEERDYVLPLVVHKGVKKGGHQLEGNTPKGKTEDLIKTDSTTDPIMFSDTFGEKIDSDLDTSEDGVILMPRMSDNIQTVPRKNEQQGFDKFISNVTGFLTNIGRQLGLYLRHMVNN